MDWTRKWVLVTVLASGVLGLTGCGGGAAPPTPAVVGIDPNSKLGLPQLIGLAPELQPETRVLSADELKTVSKLRIINPADCAPDKPGRVPCVLSLEMSPIPGDIKVGSVLAAGVSPATPGGLLVKVNSINGSLIGATEATLEDAVKQGEFQGERELGSADIQSQSLLPGLSLVPTVPTSQGLGTQNLGTQALGITVKADHTQLVPGVYANGQATFQLSCGAYGGLTYKYHVIPNGVKFEGSCQVNQTLGLDITASAGVTLDKQVVLGTFTFTPITFFIGPVPVVLVPKAKVVLNLKGEVSAQLSFGFAQSFQAKAGIKYDDGFTLIHDLSAHADAHPVTAQTEVSARAGLDFKASLLLYDLAGVSLNVGPYLQMDGGPGHNPLWCLKAGVEGGVSLDIDLVIKHLTYGPASLFDTSDQLGCAANTAPTLSIEPVAMLDADHTVYLFDRAVIVLKGNANDAEEGTALSVSWSSDRDGALTTSKSGVATDLVLHTVGRHVLTATIRDAQGAQASATFTVNVVAAQPTVALTARNSKGDVVTGPELHVQQGDTIAISAQLGYLNIGLPCTSLTWDSGGLPLTGGGCQVSLSLTTQGTFILNASASDSYGHTGSASLTIVVGPPPVVVAPQFSPILAVKTSPIPQTTLSDGDDVVANDVVSFNVQYLNAGEAKVNARYVWTLALADGVKHPLNGAPGETTSSQRSWIVPYLEQQTVTVEVQIYDAASNALIGSRNFHLIGTHIIF